MKNENLLRLAEIGLRTVAEQHDINATLSKISSEAHRLKSKEIKQYVEEIRKLLDRTNAVKRQIQNGTIKEFGMMEYCEKVKKYFREVNLEIDCKNDFKVSAYSVSIVQVLINLIDNAYYFSGGSIYAHLGKDNDVNNVMKNHKVIITVDSPYVIVSDNGDSISKDVIESMYDKYFTTKSAGSESLGLGLYDVKQHLDAIGCTITVENNTILSGANFKIDFTNVIAK